MKNFLSTICIAICLMAQGTSAKELTRAELMKGSKIPDQREFPVSKKYPACQDFHKYVCDEAESKFKLPSDRNRWYFSFNDNSERILHARKTFFKKISQGYEPKGERIAQVKNFYSSCMNVAASKKSETTYVDQKLKEINALSTNKDFQNYVGEYLTNIQFAGVDVADLPNQQNPNKKDIALIGDVSSFPVSSFYADKTALADLESLAVEFYKTLGFKDAKVRAQHLVNFEITLNKGMPLPAEFRTIMSSNTYKPKEHFVKNYPQIKWDKLFTKIPAETMLRDVTPKVLTALSLELADGDPNILKSVFIFHTLKGTMDDAYPQFHKAYYKFQNKYFGSPVQRPPRDERCTNQMVALFSFEIDEYLMPVLFPNFPKDQVVGLASEVRQAILTNIENNKWLSSQARKEAKKKMSEAPLNLVAPSVEEDWNFNTVQDYSKTDSVQNYLKFSAAKNEKMFAELSKERNRNQWGYSPLLLNAYYSPADNRFFLLQGILQPPFFDPKMTKIENLGAIGSVVGHELGHGIDDSGSKYDAEGKLNQWMSMKDLVEFSKRGGQFVKRFDDIGHNGRLTLGENIGDHVGITSSYAATFSKRTDATAEEKQSFFKAYARMWCNVATKEADANQIKTDPHSLGKERINQQVIHVDGFYEAFSCKEGDKMFVAPNERIKVW